ncbi:hypothetical protein LXL04_010706 [Taraxacum kok-saghyz]
MYQRSSGKFYRKASCRSKVVHDQSWNLRPRSEEDQNWSLNQIELVRYRLCLSLNHETDSDRLENQLHSCTLSLCSEIRRACSAAQSREDEGTAEGLCGLLVIVVAELGLNGNGERCSFFSSIQISRFGLIWDWTKCWAKIYLIFFIWGGPGLPLLTI